jgi:hypothetical protein
MALAEVAVQELQNVVLERGNARIVDQCRRARVGEPALKRRRPHPIARGLAR